MTSQAAPPSSPPQRAWRSPKAWGLLLGVLVTGVLLDLCLKEWSFQHVAPQPVELPRASTGALRSLLDGVEAKIDVVVSLVVEPPPPDATRLEYIPRHTPVRVIPGGLNLHLVENEGAVFGIGAEQRVFFIAFTVLALGGAILVFSRWTTSRSHLAHVAIGLILAGGLGNLFDRLHYAVVRDFLHMLPGWTLPLGLNWPGGSNEVFPWVFNAADVMLLTGMGLLILHMNRVEKRRKAAQGAAATAEGAGSV